MPAAWAAAPAPRNSRLLNRAWLSDVQQAAAEAQDGHRAQPVGQAEQPQPQAHQDDADVLDAVIGQQALQVVLGQGEQHAQDPGQRADRQQRPAPPGWRRAQEEQGAQDPVDPHLDHHPAHQRRYVGRRRRVGLGEPDVQRHDARLGAEAQQGQHEGAAGRGPGQAAEAGEVQPAPAQQEEQGHQEGGADLRCGQVGQPCPSGAGLLVLEGDQEPGADGHGLPGQEEQHGVAGQDHHGHAGHQQVVEQPGGAQAAGGMAQIPAAVERRNRADAVHRQQKEAGQGIQGHAEGAPDLPQPGQADGAGQAQRQRRDGAGQPEQIAGRAAPAADRFDPAGLAAGRRRGQAQQAEQRRRSQDQRAQRASFGERTERSTAAAAARIWSRAA